MTGTRPEQRAEPGSSKAASLSVVVPAFNEEEGIGSVVKGADEALKQAGVKAEILVVDDGSTDRTADRAAEAGARVIRHDVNQGYGSALNTGVRLSGCPYVAIIDGDGTYPTSNLAELSGLIPDYDMVVGARTGKSVHIPWIRRPAKWFLGKLAQYLSRRKIPDLNSGLRIMRKEVVDRFMPLLPTGFSWTTTITLALLVGGYRVKFVPIDYEKRKGRSKIRPIRDTIGFMGLIIRTVLYFNPLRVFIPVSLLLILAGAAVFAGSWIWLPKILDTTTALLVITGVQVAVLGLLADLVARRRG